MTDLAVASPKRSAPKPALPVDVAAPEQPPYLMAAFVALGTLLLYVATLAPTTQFWDTSEYIAAAKVLGIVFNSDSKPLYGYYDSGYRRYFSRTRQASASL